MDDSRTPLLIVLAGINGAGKSTYYDLFLRRLGLPFVNADLIARQEWPEDPEGHAYEAAKRAQEIRSALLRKQASFVTETVLSHPSKVEFLAEARQAGYRVVLIYLHLQTPLLAKLRVMERVDRGGHRVPHEKIDQRYPRVLHHLESAIRMADDVLLFDNSILGVPFRHVASLRQGRLAGGGPDLPRWVVRLLGV